MLFNSVEAAAAVAAMLVLYWRLGQRPRLWLIVCASAAFYASFDVRFLALLWFVIAFTFCTARRIGPDAGSERRRWFVLSILTNLSVLGAFKYVDFFAESAASLLEALGFEASVISLNLLLPVGISFYVFQAISYSTDVYRGRINPEPDLLTFTAFLSFFPQLAAGPIERGERLLPQMRSLPRQLRPGDIRIGLSLILLGLVRKVVIADTMAPLVVRAYTEEREFFGATYEVQHSWALLLAGMFAFGAQMYGDFAGYSTIARGLGKLFGIDLSTNFQRPVWATSLGALWRRWHITLIAFLRDYVYFPLRRSRAFVRLFPRAGRYIATVLVFVLAGVWHGPEPRWLVWGGLTGLFLAAELWWTSVVGARRRAAANRSNRAGPRRVVFTAATLTTSILLVAPVGAGSVANAVSLWTAVATLQAGVVQYDVIALVVFAWIVVALTDRHEICLEETERWWHQRGGGRPLPGRHVRPPRHEVHEGLTATIMVLSLLLFSGADPVPYFYFAF